MYSHFKNIVTYEIQLLMFILIINLTCKKLITADVKALKKKRYKLCLQSNIILYHII